MTTVLVYLLVSAAMTTLSVYGSDAEKSSEAYTKGVDEHYKKCMNELCAKKNLTEKDYKEAVAAMVKAAGGFPSTRDKKFSAFGSMFGLDATSDKLFNDVLDENSSEIGIFNKSVLARVVRAALIFNQPANVSTDELPAANQDASHQEEQYVQEWSYAFKNEEKLMRALRALEAEHEAEAVN